MIPLEESRDEYETACSRASKHVPDLYSAVITHTRRVPITNRFRSKASYWLVDYDHLPPASGIVGRLARLERGDHSDIRAILTEHGVGAERILMLAMARSLGYVFNPISIFWCYGAAGERVAVLAEVHNTHGGRHTYLLRPDENGRAEMDKVLYVSPYYPIDGYYDFRVSEPGPSVAITVTLQRKDDPPFVATLHGERRKVNVLNVILASLGRPSLRVALLIRWQALRLRARGLKVQPK